MADKPSENKKGKPKASAAKPAEKPSKPKGLSKVKEEIEKRRREEERLKQQAEEEERRIEEEYRLQKEQEEKEKQEKEEKKRQKKEKRDALKAQGLLLTDKQKEDKRKIMEMLESRGLTVGQPDHDDSKKTSKVRRNKKYKPQRSQTNDAEIITPEAELIELKISESDYDDKETSGLDDWEDLADTLEENKKAGEQIPKASATGNSLKNKYSGPIHETLTEEDKAKLISATRADLKEKHKIFEAERTNDNLRSGVICVLGHVDTGKTKILDKLRNTNVQDREAGGITQQIGATNVPAKNIIDGTYMCKEYFDTSKMILPGLLIIDTPGHESFSNLRIRGSSLCDMAILVVDLMHSLEEQTKESIKILQARKTPFVVALNKIDRLYGWKSSPKESVAKVIPRQSVETMNDFNDRLKRVISDFAVMELNARLFYEKLTGNEDDTYINMVPTSAHTGDGMGDLLTYISHNLQTNLAPKISFSNEFTASVMEVKDIDGLGTTLDAIVVNGTLKQGDHVVLAGTEGPFVTQVRSLLQPAPMSELRVKSNYHQLKEVKGAQGVKLTAKGLENALAGMPLYIAHNIGEELYYQNKLERGLADALKAIQVSSLGVYVMASTLGSLESLLVYLKDNDIPYSGINIGTVHKKDVMKASIMIQRDPKWAIILAFDVKVDKEAVKMAAEMNVRIFTSDIIYSLQDQMTKYFEELKTQNRVKHRDQAVFPVRLKILPDMVFNKRAPIVMGVRVEAGLLKVGTPLCVPTKECVEIGKVFSIESNHNSVQDARVGQEVCIRVDPLEGETPKLFGRHFDATDEVVSKISRVSIDVMKEYFREDLSKDEWRLMAELKKRLGIP